MKKRFKKSYSSAIKAGLLVGLIKILIGSFFVVLLISSKFSETNYLGFLIMVGIVALTFVVLFQSVIYASLFSSLINYLPTNSLYIKSTTLAISLSLILNLIGNIGKVEIVGLFIRLILGLVIAII